MCGGFRVDVMDWERWDGVVAFGDFVFVREYRELGDVFGLGCDLVVWCGLKYVERVL